MNDITTSLHDFMEVVKNLCLDMKTCSAILDGEGENAPDEDARPFWRRLYARATFAYFDGLTYHMMYYAYEARFRWGTLLTAEEIMRLQKYYDFDADNEAVTAISQRHMLDNIRFAFRVFAHANFSDRIIPFHAPEWESLKEMALVRHRMLYPKKAEDVEVSDDEVEILIDAINWVARQLSDSIDDIRERILEKFDELTASEEDEIIM